MIQKNVTVYKCDFCRKKLFVKKAMEKHEANCFHNPVNHRPCFGCIHLEKKETIIYDDSPMGGEIKRNVELLYCSAKKVFLYTPKNERKGNWFDLGDDINEKMPIECGLMKISY